MSSVRSIDDVIRDLRTYGSVHLTLSGIVFLPTVVVWFVSFCVVRARGDPVRRLPFTWMKVAYPMFALYVTVAITLTTQSSAPSDARTGVLREAPPKTDQRSRRRASRGPGDPRLARGDRRRFCHVAIRRHLSLVTY